MGGSGSYRKNVSPWVIGYLFTVEQSGDMVAYPDQSVLHERGYQGAYFKTAADATLSETMLCEAMDRITEYESEKYGVQRPIGFTSGSSTDFLEYEPLYARQLRKYASLDAEHILPGEKNLAGQMAAYRLGSVREDFAEYLREEQRAELLPALSSSAETDSCGGYLTCAAYHHTVPVVGFY
jgi:hypothetical protein